MKLRAALFDYGGTLDGGSHWLVRFDACYRRAGLPLPFETLRAAFDHATHCAYTESGVAELGLHALIEFHVARQMQHLGPTDSAVAAAIIADFESISRAGLAASRTLLQRLRPLLALGVVSNFYGNVDRILAEAGLTPLLDTIVDSAVVGVSKPDPRIFALAVQRLGCPPDEALYVGDSFEKDIVGAHAAGLRTAWLTASESACPAPERVDFRVTTLADVEAVLRGDRRAAAG